MLVLRSLSIWIRCTMPKYIQNTENATEITTHTLFMRIGSIFGPLPDRPIRADNAFESLYSRTATHADRGV